MTSPTVLDPNAMEPLHERDELKDAPILRSIPKVDPFGVPDGFFEQFPHAIQASIAQRQGVWARFSGWVGDLSLTLRLAGATAMIAVIASAAFFALRNAPRTDQPLIAEITLAPTELDPSDVDEVELLAMMEDDPSFLNDAGDGLTEDEMAVYLDNEELPLDLLIEEL